MIPVAPIHKAGPDAEASGPAFVGLPSSDGTQGGIAKKMREHCGLAVLFSHFVFYSASSVGGRGFFSRTATLRMKKVSEPMAKKAR